MVLPKEIDMRRMTAALMLVTTILTGSAMAGDVGVKTIAVQAAHRDRPIQTLIWYPAVAGGLVENVGDNPLFEGVPALRDAAMAEGLFPVIILSHGSGGNAANLGWLATALAEEGFIVAAPNHPGTTSGDSTPAETVKFWERPADLSAVLTQLLADEEMGERIDRRNLSLAGFSLGGYAVLTTAGARADAKAYARYCDTNTEKMSECAWLAKGGVDLHQLDDPRVNQSNLDARFTSVVAIDPGLAQAYREDSLAEINIPTLVINFGRPGKVPLAVDSQRLVKIIPHSEYRTIADAIHFSFLGICKANAAAVLAAEGETDPLCDDGGGRPRKAIHDEIIGMVSGFLKAKLAK